VSGGTPCTSLPFTRSTSRITESIGPPRSLLSGSSYGGAGGITGSALGEGSVPGAEGPSSAALLGPDESPQRRPRHHLAREVLDLHHDGVLLPRGGLDGGDPAHAVDRPARLL